MGGSGVFISPHPLPQAHRRLDGSLTGGHSCSWQEPPQLPSWGSDPLRALPFLPLAPPGLEELVLGDHPIPC